MRGLRDLETPQRECARTHTPAALSRDARDADSSAVDRSSRRAIVTALLSTAIVGGGCASSAVVRPPAAFPAAPSGPAAIRPERLELERLAPAAELVRAAFELRGVPYRLGGESPADGFDCSGFVRYVFGLSRWMLPRTVVEQFAEGAPVDPPDVREGDLVFFSTVAPGPSHVGIAVAPGLFIHAPGANGAVRIERFDAPYWQSRLVGARRLL